MGKSVIIRRFERALSGNKSRLTYTSSFGNYDNFYTDMQECMQGIVFF
jgi:hypothetical protein